MLTQTLDAVVIKRPEASDELPQNLCLDAGFIGKEHEKSVEERNYIPHIRPRGEEKQEIKKILILSHEDGLLRFAILGLIALGNLITSLIWCKVQQ